ncbi:hypothetical protein GXM_00059 [Nostoc sphaeroides CCNUC1]|uniref:Uncharacterized protein n=1 Tax=Nostoc sphaeroides CCNUC1 TaxID=2653204 RepID=A0A5P8VQS9_9NOSO|nr:hypothetical protein GXM_00059 [Nostoc sphaeroides CCNUC1]
MILIFECVTFDFPKGADTTYAGGYRFEDHWKEPIEDVRKEFRLP